MLVNAVFNIHPKMKYILWCSYTQGYRGCSKSQKNSPPDCREGYFNKGIYNYAWPATETNDLSFFPFLNTTTPSARANKVWSLPIPTLSPG